MSSANHPIRSSLTALALTLTVALSACGGSPGPRNP
jgi:hypothetical protein